jgi:Cu/Zn superoxide dismutase
MMRGILLVALFAVTAQANVFPRAFCRFWSVAATPMNNGYVIVNTTDGALMVSGSLAGFAASSPYTVFVHTNGDVGDGTTATNAGACLSQSPFFKFTTDANGAFSFGDMAVGTAGLALMGDQTTSIVGRALVAHAGDQSSCAGTQTLFSQAVVGIANTSASDQNSAYIATTPSMVAYARIIGSNSYSGISGEFWWTPDTTGTALDGGPSTVRIYARVQGTGLSAGTHGMHVHIFGDTSDMIAYLSAGGHYNPTNALHGSPMAASRHTGDMGNVTVNANNVGGFSDVFLDLQTTHASPSNIIGRCVLVHGAPDDGFSQPVGNAGARWAAGVIGLSTRTAPRASSSSGGSSSSSSSTGQGAASSVTPSAVVALLVLIASVAALLKH